MDLSRDNVLWFSGLFEGEGSLSRCRPNSTSSWRMSLRMTDKDVIEKIQKCFGGQVYEDSKKSKYKQSWSWQLGKQDHIYPICAALYQFMGERRKSKMFEFFEYYKNPRKKRDWPHKVPYKNKKGVYINVSHLGRMPLL